MNDVIKKLNQTLEKQGDWRWEDKKIKNPKFYLNVQEYISEYGIDSLKEYKGVLPHHYDNYVSLNYIPYECPKFDSIADECRGLILDKNDWSVLSIGFSRFYNEFEDPCSASFNFSKSNISEKLDGTYISIYWNPYLDSWCPSTRRMAHAEGGTTINPDRSFASYVEEALGNLNERFKNINKNLVCLFELTSPFTRVIKKYTETKMTLLTVVNRKTGYDYLFHSKLGEIRDELKVKLPTIYKSKKSFKEVSEMLDQLDQDDEGFVCSTQIKLGAIWRLKIKNPRHIALSVMKNNGLLSRRSIVNLVWTGEYTEYCHYFPECEEMFIPYINAREYILNKIENVWDRLKVIDDQKEFAEEVLKRPKYLQGFLFGFKKGGNVDSIFDSMLETSKVKLFKMAIEEMNEGNKDE